MTRPSTPTLAAGWPALGGWAVAALLLPLLVVHAESWRVALCYPT